MLENLQNKKNIDINFCQFFRLRILENIYYIGGDEEELNFIIAKMVYINDHRIKRPGEFNINQGRGQQLIHAIFST